MCPQHWFNGLLWARKIILEKLKIQDRLTRFPIFAIEGTDHI